MRINFRLLKKLPVETESGKALGRVDDIELNAESHTINKYFVSPSRWIPGTTMAIAPEQIIRIDADKMIVRDAAVKIFEKEQLSANIEPAALNAAQARRG